MAHRPKMTASSAADTAISSAFSDPRERYSALAAPEVKAPSIASQATGTWK